MPRAPKKAKPPKVDRLIQRPGGKLWQKCQRTKGNGRTCSRTRPVEEFAPRKNERFLAEFMQAILDYQELQMPSDRATIVQHVTAWCDHCRDIKKRSKVNPNTKSGKCRAYLQELRETEFRRCKHCSTRRCIELDNVVSDADRAVLYAEGKVSVPKHYPLGDYYWWAQPAHGGVEGMRLEKAVCEPACRMCHRLQPTSNAGSRVDPSTLPPAVDQESKVDQKMYKKRCIATKRWPRYCYVDRRKRAIGGCENLNCLRDGAGNGRCIAGVEPAFEWDHNPEKKSRTISWLCQNLPAKMPESEWKAIIDIEIADGECRLLCANCHHEKTNGEMVPLYE